MAAPLVQRVEVDLATANRQIAELERELATLNNPILIPVDVETDQALDKLRRDVAAADNQTVDIDVDVDGIQRAESEISDLGREVDQAGDEFDEMGRKADRSTDAVLRVGTRGASAFTSLRGSIIGVGAALAAIQGAQVLGRGLAAAVQEASNLEESLSKTNVVFEQFSGEIQDFAGTAPQALGLSTAAALEATSTFGNLFVALGLSREAAAELSPEIIQLASDLSSFNNIAVEEAVEKLRAGLVGEVEPLRTLGVSLNAALVEAKALELGLVDASGAVTEAGKVQARYALIVEQTVTAQGDFARTADGIANTQRTLSGEFQNASAALGQALLPAYGQLLDLAPSLIDAIGNLTPVIAGVSQAMADAAPSATGFADALQAVGEVPAAFGNLFSILEGLAGVVAGPIQFLGDFEAGAARTNAALEELSGTFESIRFAQLRNALVDTLQAGVDPALALADALVELTTLDLNPQELAAAAAAFTQIAGVDPSRAKDLAITIERQAAAIGLEADETAALVVALRQLFEVEAPGSLARGAGARREAADAARLRREAAEKAAAAAITEAQALDTLEQFAAATGQTLLDLLQNTDRLPPSLQAVAAAVSGTSVAFLDSVSRADEFADSMREIPEALADARTAFQTEAGEFETNVEDFIDNLIESLDARDRFEENLATLRGLGGELLANLFETEGIESAPLLEALIGTPAQIAAGEARLEQEAVEAARITFDTYAETIAAADFGAIPIEPVEVPVEADLSAFLASLAGLPGVVDFAVTVPVVPAEGGTGGGRGRGRSDGGRSDLASVDVTQNFFTEPQPTTQTERAAAEINSIVSFAQGRGQ